MKYIKCGKTTKELYNIGSLQSLTEGCCKECSEEEINKDLELIEAIKRGENISKYIK